MQVLCRGWSLSLVKTLEKWVAHEVATQMGVLSPIIIWRVPTSEHVRQPGRVDRNECSGVHLANVLLFLISYVANWFGLAMVKFSAHYYFMISIVPIFYRFFYSEEHLEVQNLHKNCIKFIDKYVLMLTFFLKAVNWQ